MRISKYLFLSQKSTKEKPIKKLDQICFINKECSGIFEYTPFATRVLQKIENIIRRELNKIGALECRLPILQPGELWERSDRTNSYGKETFKLFDRNGKLMLLAPTAEEAALNLIEKYAISYKQLPVSIYQILEKYRDEIRPRFELVRARQFTMKDAYSFCETELQGYEMYVQYFNAYTRIFRELEIDTIPVKAETGAIGGNFSHEFVVISDVGEENIYFEEIKDIYLNSHEDVQNIKTSRENIYSNCAKSLELGHVYHLGDVYSKKMNSCFSNSKGEKIHYVMGCYGIGVSRILAFLSSREYWPLTVSPFNLHIIGIDKEKSLEIYEKYEKYNEILWDDRDCSVGCKFYDADLIGIPYRLIIGKEIELFYKKTKIEIGSIQELHDKIESILNLKL
jgi:prolyl-tRNA synthetase